MNEKPENANQDEPAWVREFKATRLARIEKREAADARQLARIKADTEKRQRLHAERIAQLREQIARLTKIVDEEEDTVLLRWSDVSSLTHTVDLVDRALSHWRHIYPGFGPVTDLIE